jgi:hypothetical protein
LVGGCGGVVVDDVVGVDAVGVGVWWLLRLGRRRCRIGGGLVDEVGAVGVGRWGLLRWEVC